jgi:hypothetical protein
MDEPALRFIGSMAMILLFLVRPMMASFKKNLFKFCPKLTKKTQSLSLFCRVRAF